MSVFNNNERKTKQVHEAYGRIHVRGDNGKYQAHGPDGKYVGQFSTKDEAKKRLEELAGVLTVEEGPETKLDEQREKTQIPEKQHSQQPIRGSDSMLEIEETPAPWTREDRSNQSRGERALENVNWVFRKSKGAYWVVAGVAGLGTLSALMGVWGK